MNKFQEKLNVGIVKEIIVKEIEFSRLRYFEGPINHNMPLLLSGTDKEGNVVDIPRTPMTLRQLLDYRVNGTNVNDRNLLRDRYCDVAFAEIGNPNGSGEIKYVHYSQPLVKELFNSLNPKSDIQNGKLVLTLDQYMAIPEKDSLVISFDIANALRQKGYAHQDIRKRIWTYGAEGDEKLVEDNLKLVQERIAGDFSNRMGIFPSKSLGLGSWYVVRLVDGGRSDAYGRFGLGFGFGRFVGVAPEAQNTALQYKII